MSSSLKSPRGHGATDRGLLEAAHATASNQINRRAFEGRFGRMFPDLPAAIFFYDELKTLATDMGVDAKAEPDQTPETSADSEENFGLPAGYTYFGQFVDHDMTLDAVSLSMQQEDLNAVENFRTPALDLDSLYGRGPADQPYMYDEHERLFLLGDRMLTSGEAGADIAPDLPRFKTRAIIGDKRNDENVIVSQLHGLFLRLHNKIASMCPKLDFNAVRQQVRWHYQWLVLFDYLPRILGKSLIDELVPTIGVKPVLKHFKFAVTAFMPVEFSGAVYRFGHSMVRPIYRLNCADDIGGPDGDKARRLVFNQTDGATAGSGKGLNGFGVFDQGLGIDWSLFFETPGRTLEGEIGRGKARIQPAYKIDTSLVFPLTRLPEFSRPDGEPIGTEMTNVLAFRNMQRGMMLLLPSGQSIAVAMGCTVIADEDLIVEKADAQHLRSVPGAKPLRCITTGRPRMAGSAPLWFYVLAEARHGWRKDAEAYMAAHPQMDAATRDAAIDRIPVRLGDVGGRIVAEAFVGLLAGDTRSLLNEGSRFCPMFGAERGDRFQRFTMGDLVTAMASP